MAPSEDVLIEQNEWWQFQKDTAHSHTACIVKAWVKGKIKFNALISSIIRFESNQICLGFDVHGISKFQISSMSSLKQELDTIWRRVVFVLIYCSFFY